MPLREIKRLQALDRFLSIQFENEKEVRDLVQLAAEVCSAKIASITILDTVAPHFHYNWGITPENNYWHEAFSDIPMVGQRPFIVQDTWQEPKLLDNPYVLGAPFIRSYVNVPLLTHDAHKVGTLCVLSDHCLTLSETQLSMLSILAKQIVQLFELQASIMLLKEKLEDVRLSQIRLKSFFNSKLVLHLLLDTNFRILSYNTIFADLVFENCAEDPKEGDDVRRYIQKHSALELMQSYKLALKGEPSVVHVDSKSKKSHLYWLVYFEPALDPEDNIIGVSCNALDVTQKVKQDARLTEQNEHLRRVTFYQSHELRRPVSSILGIAEYLGEKFGKDMPEEIAMLKLSTKELDEKIKNIVNLTDFNKH